MKNLNFANEYFFFLAGRNWETEFMAKVFDRLGIQYVWDEWSADIALREEEIKILREEGVKVGIIRYDNIARYKDTTPEYDVYNYEYEGDDSFSNQNGDYIIESFICSPSFGTRVLYDFGLYEDLISLLILAAEVRKVEFPDRETDIYWMAQEVLSEDECNHVFGAREIAA